MIDKLIEKYNKKLKYITDLKNKTSFELVRVNCLEKEFIVKEIIKDLEKIEFGIDKKSLLAYLDYGCGSYFELGSQHEEFLENIKEYLEVDIDE